MGAAESTEAVEDEQQQKIDVAAAAPPTNVAPPETIAAEHANVSSTSLQPTGGTATMTPTTRAPSESTSSTRRSGLGAWSRRQVSGLFSKSKPNMHTDPKDVFEGLEGMSLFCALGRHDQVKRLIAEKRNVDAKDVDGDRVPLHWAAARGDIRCVELLLKAGADASIRDASGRTPADLAIAPGVDQLAAHRLIDEFRIVTGAKLVQAGGGNVLHA